MSFPPGNTGARAGFPKSCHKAAQSIAEIAGNDIASGPCRSFPAAAASAALDNNDGGTRVDAKLSNEELHWLKILDTDTPEKPDLPGPIADMLVERGLAIKLVEGGLQLTALGREYLTQT
jgi:hypothetical protein